MLSFLPFSNMPRTYKAIKPQPVDKIRIQQCLEYMVEMGLSLNAAANHFGLPEATVRRHKKHALLNAPLTSPGGQPSLPPDMQADIASIARISASHDFGFSKEELRLFIGGFIQENWDATTPLGNYLRKYCRFKDHLPSNDWVTSFLSDHHLSLKKPSLLEKCRHESASDPFIIYEFFDLLEAEVTRLNLRDAPHHIWNLDESAFFTDPRGGKVVAEIGSIVKWLLK
jgi:hypothetical protein